VLGIDEHHLEIAKDGARRRCLNSEIPVQAFRLRKR
jgi:hypothetical protein